MSKLKMTRRSFVRAMAVTGAAATLSTAWVPDALAASTSESPADTGVQYIRTGCRGCGKMECGVIAVVRDGKVIRVQGDQDAFQSMGNCCTKSQASVQAAYHPDRLHYPVKRTNDKYSDDPGWERVSWDEGVALMCDKFDELQARYGGECLFGQCGTSRVWCMFGASNGMWLWNSPNIAQAWQICKGPRHFASLMDSVFTLPWLETVARPSVFVQWGGSSEISNYDDSCRTTVDVGTRADCHISVDPRSSNFGKEADLQLRLRPGTDAAMAMAWTYVVMKKELIDDLFVKRWTDMPFLIIEDYTPQEGYMEMSPIMSTPYMLMTHMLTEGMLVAGGSFKRYLVWDTLAGLDDAHPLHQTYLASDPTGHLTYFDADTGLWEGETWTKPTAGHEAMQENLVKGMSEGFVIDPTPFDPEIDPALTGEYAVTLKDGTGYKVRPVYDVYFDRLEADYTPEKAAAITGVDAGLIEEAATRWATRIYPERGYPNGGIQYMLAIEHSCNAIQCVRALDVLISLVGALDTPGGHRASTRAPIEGGQMGFANNGNVPPLDPFFGQINKILGGEKMPLLKWWGMWADAGTVFDAALTGEPYPVRGGFNSSGNFMHQCNSQRVWEALQSLDFYAEANLWHTPGGTLCDVKFPAAHWLELSSPRASQGASGAMGATCKCIEPPGEALFDGMIYQKFYQQKGISYTGSAEKPYLTNEEMLDASVKAFAPSWEEYRKEFQEHGWWDCKQTEPELWGTYRRYETGAFRARNAGGFVGTTGDFKPGFYTPTMKVEAWSTVMESHHPETPLWYLPSYEEPPHSPVSDPDMAKEYPIICTTGRRIPVYFHSEHRQLPWCRELWPVPRVEINPKTAESYGIKQGDWVWIESPYGKIRECADLFYGIKSDTINCEHTWWYPELDQAGKGFELSQVNQLIDHDARDPHCGASNLRAYQVKIYKATAENSPFGDPCPCGHDGTEIIHTPDDPRLKEWLPITDDRVGIQAEDNSVVDCGVN